MLITKTTFIMAQLTKLGIQNFRVFGSETMTEFDFAPITLLTGANNSGKSSVLKALSLLKNSFDKNGNIEKLNFEGLDLGTYEMNVNKKKKDLIIKLYRNDNFFIEYHYGSSQELKKVHIFYNSKRLVKIDAELIFINFLLFKKIINNPRVSENYTLFPNYSEDDFENINKPLINQKNKGLRELKKKEKEFLRNLEYSNSKLSQKIIHFFNEGEFEGSEYDFPTQSISASLKHFFQYMRMLQNYNKFSGNDDEMPWIDTDEMYISEIGKTFFGIIKTCIFNLVSNGEFLNFSYLTAHKANQQILHTTDSKKTDFSILLSKYYEWSLNPNDVKNEIIQFVNTKIDELLIPDYKLVVKNLGIDYNTEAYIAYLEKGNNRKILSNFGFGVTQLITLFIKIAIAGYKETIIIEEPETNLHPKLQTQLAKLFVDAYKEFGTRFIIETHSEYLVRGLQLEVAKGFKPENLNMYYLNNLQQYNEKPQVENIKFDIEGNIFNAENPEIKNENVFNSGFFDENEKTLYLKQLYNEIGLEHQYKYLIFTEDGNDGETEKEDWIKVLLESSSLGQKLLEDAKILNYNGKTNLKYAAFASENFLKNNNVEYVIFHIDNDCMGAFEEYNKQVNTKPQKVNADENDTKKEINKIKQDPKSKIFITKGYDIESYFLEEEYINKHFSISNAEELLQQATEEEKNTSIKKIQNSLFKGNCSQNANDIAIKIYEIDTEKYKFSKAIFRNLKKRLANQLNISTEEINNKIKIPADYLKCEELEKILKEIFPNN